MPAKKRTSSPQFLEEVEEDEVVEEVEEVKRDVPEDPVVEDYDNRPNTQLFDLADVQAYELEVARAKADDREPELTDPRLRTHDVDPDKEEVAPFVDTFGGGTSLNAGVSNPESLVKPVEDGTQLETPEAYTEPEEETEEDAPVGDVEVVKDEDELIEHLTVEDEEDK